MTVLWSGEVTRRAEDIATAVAIIESWKFRWAKSKTNPHSYVVKADGRKPQSWLIDAEVFDWVAQLVWDIGTPVTFFGDGKDYHQFYANGWFYWTSGPDGPNGPPSAYIFNRKRYAQEHDETAYSPTIAEGYDSVYDTELHHAENQAVADRLQPIVEGKNVLDLGCGTGLFLDMDLRFEGYLGVDPSPDMLDVARAKHPLEKFWCCRAEDVWKDFDESWVILGLFGSASYIPPEATQRLSKGGAGMFLMHYAPWYRPTLYEAPMTYYEPATSEDVMFDSFAITER